MSTGFLGSSESFHLFPHDLSTALLNNHDIEVDTLTYTYETRGDNLLAVQQLVSFLKRNAPSDKRSCVILIAHSMGGILAVDAAREILSGTVEGITTRPATNIADAVSAEAEKQISQPNPATSPSSQSAGFPDCTIIGLLAFDSPYFGVHDNVFTATARERVIEAAETVQSWAEWLGWSQTESTTAKIAGASAAAGATAAVAAETIRRNSMTLEEDTEDRGRTLSPKPSEPSSSTSPNRALSPFKSSWWKWGALSVAAAAVTGVAAYATSKEVAKQVDKVVTDSSEYARSHMQFLGPLWTDLSQMKDRMKDVLKMGEMMSFYSYYTKLPPLSSPPALPSSPSSENPDSPTFSPPPLSPPPHRTFIVPPPTILSHLFEPHSMPKARDEIEAHTNIFDMMFDGEAYQALKTGTAKIVADIVREKGSMWL
ncbi:hypothetical protein HDV00_008541 [Rhizophlyctis rosea]|nr:hypothetical protein HDV00_008541 [Rhizophlyctis rosea]